jgi:FkbM family methyltransferase
MLTSPWVAPFRRLSRRLGLNRFIAQIIYSGQYEDQFGPAVLQQICPGDTVWDIGANVGLYTQKFLDVVSPSGHIVAFEPVPSCFSILKEKFNGNHSVNLMNVAIGASDGIIAMSLETDPLAATHRIVESQSQENMVDVSIRSVSSIIQDSPELFPNIIKIDVEGHEGEVMDGMENILIDSRLRCIGIEVHFSLLDQRGESKRPQEMEKTLLQHGFQVTWTDASHLLAIR